MKQLLLFFVATFFSIQLNAQWLPCGIAPNGNSTFGTSVCVHNNKLYATNNHAGLLVSNDYGATWDTVNATITAPQVNLYSTGDRLYALFHNSGCTNIQYSIDNGLTFQIDTAGLPLCFTNAVTTPSAGGKAWTNHLMLSVAGPDWEFVRNTSNNRWEDAEYFNPNDCSEFFVKNDTCWAATNGATSNGVAWSIDGLNWTSPTSSGIPGFYVPTQIAWIGNKLLLMGSDVGAGAAGIDTIIKYSTDYGQSFQEYNIKQYLDGSPFFTFTGKQPTLDIYTGYGKVYLTLGNDVLESAPELIVSEDGGATFAKDTVGFPNNVLGSNFTINGMEFLGGWVFAQVNSGDLYRKSIGSTSISENQTHDNFKIFPNPSANTINIEGLSEKEFSISIYDVMGKQLLDKKASNSSSAKIDVSFLSSGIYFIGVKTSFSNEILKFIKE